MRNKQRIKPFCDELANVWEKSFPDWRFGQLMSNFLGWYSTEKKKDIFFPEEDEMIMVLKEFANKYSMWNRDYADDLK